MKIDKVHQHKRNFKDNCLEMELLITLIRRQCENNRQIVFVNVTEIETQNLTNKQMGFVFFFLSFLLSKHSIHFDTNKSGYYLYLNAKANFGQTPCFKVKNTYATTSNMFNTNSFC